jgi:hypothetical protein
VSVALPRRCGDCDAVLADRQRWCLACGGAARVALAPAPRWQARAGVAGVLGALALAAVVIVLAILV